MIHEQANSVYSPDFSKQPSPALAYVIFGVAGLVLALTMVF